VQEATNRSGATKIGHFADIVSVAFCNICLIMKAVNGFLYNDTKKDDLARPLCMLLLENFLGHVRRTLSYDR